MSEKSIELLNKGVAEELHAVHQYMYFHFHCDDQGFDLISELFEKKAIEEMKHVERFAERILFLGGEVEMVASLPHYNEGQTDAQRGEGIFQQSLEALRRLNALGYGEEGSGLVLNLVTNPVGAFLPARQEALERVKQERPDLVTLDISMPQASGARFYKEVKSDPELASIPVVIVTAVTGYGGGTRAYEKFISGRRTVPPPEGFFPKPINREEFLETVETLLAATKADSLEE